MITFRFVLAFFRFFFFGGNQCKRETSEEKRVAHVHGWGLRGGGSREVALGKRFLAGETGTARLTRTQLSELMCP